ncbi:MAG: hypothetical protein IJN42_03815 [Clostridia bacterium]|nr:hypothetical protein [Clostridia bacterium]
MKKTFLTGAVGYGLLELLWRGRTHPSMLLCGGVCLCGIRRLCKKMKNVFWIAAAAAAMITAVEFVTGLVVNRKHGVWDYTEEWGNVGGQICPRFSLFWFLLSLPFVIYFKCKES